MPDYIVQEVTRIDVVTAATQGLPGIQGPRGFTGPPGGAALQFDAAAAIGGHRVVLLDQNGQLAYADRSNVSHMGRVVGVTLNAAEAGAPCTVQNFDRIVEGSWNWAVNQPIFLGTNGLLTQVAPTSGFLMAVGFAVSPTTMFVKLGEPILLS